MPDPEIERLAGDGLRPDPDFVAGLRERMVAEWRGDAVPPRRPWRVWLVAAAAVVAVIGAVAWVGTRDDRDVTVTPDPTTPVVSDPVPSTTSGSPTDGVPSTAFGQLWVVTTKAGLTVEGPDLPTFTFRADETIDGWDGCNQYFIEIGESGSTAAGCPEGVVPVMAAPPYTFDGDTALTTPEFQAVRFGSSSDADAAPVLSGHLLYGDVGGFSLFFGGVLTIDSNGCEIAHAASWTLESDVLRFDLGTVPECYALDAGFAEWLQQMERTGATIDSHAEPDALVWWARIGDRVTRLVSDASEVNVPTEIVDLDATEELLLAEVVRDDLASAFYVPGTVLPSGRVFVAEASGVDDRWRVVEVVDGQYVPTDLLVDTLLPTAADERLYSIDVDTNELVAYGETAPGEWTESDRAPVYGECYYLRLPRSTECSASGTIAIDPPVEASIVVASPERLSVTWAGTTWNWRFILDSVTQTLNCDSDTCVLSWFRWGDDGALYAPFIDGPGASRQLVVLVRPEQPTVVSWLGCGSSCRVIGVSDGAIYAIESHPDGPSTLWRLGLPAS
jgi:hypothetical protein